MKKILRVIFDILFAFGVVGYIFGLVFGMTTKDGFNLSGMPALLLFAWLIFYFWGLNKMGKKTLGKMIFKV